MSSFIGEINVLQSTTNDLTFIYTETRTNEIVAE